MSGPLTSSPATQIPGTTASSALSWPGLGTLCSQILAVLDAFSALLEFFRNSALNLTWSGSVPVWLTNLFRASHRPTLRVTLPEFIAYAPG